MIHERIIGYIEESIRKNWDIEALSDYRGSGYTYREIAEKIIRFHMIFREAGLAEGDKIALIGRNSANWCGAYLAAITYGAVIVPLLPDFRSEDLVSLVNHSDSKILFVDQKIWDGMDYSELPAITSVFKLETYEYLEGRDPGTERLARNIDAEFSEKYPELTPADMKFSGIDNEELAVISYTSGSTGNSKGVMVPHRSLAANVRFAQNNMPLKPGDRIVSFLPLAHTFGCSFEFLFPFSIGCHITILTRVPSPQVIMQAFKEIRPRLILSVPLVVEKIYKKKLLPVISKPHMKVLLAIPGLNRIITNKIRNMLFETFGGNFHELVVGGAAFNADGERFFRKIRFPFTVGYGMTECGPLISYASWDTTRLGASGRPVDTLEVAIDSSDPLKEVGEILVRGENVMLGYYKNEKATREAIDENGWLHTGDLGVVDLEGNIYIRGRSKSMLLGPSGQNIYPEEVESVINNHQYIGESLVISEDNRLVALVYPDFEEMKSNNVAEADLEAIYEQIRREVNTKLPSYMGISKFRIHPEEFEKTPKRNIKRFLYS